MTEKITKPGVYSLTSEEYHGSPCDGPSLGSTGARELIKGCPASFRYKQDHPEVKEAFDIGNATHLLVLEPELFESRIGRVPFDDYKKAEARAARDDIRASGRLPFLPRHLEQIEGMRDAVWSHPIARLAFHNCKIERSVFWRDKDYGHWNKCRPDCWPDSPSYLADVKTTSSADPEEFEKSIHNFGYHQQADFYLSGVEAVTGIRPAKFAFIVVAKEPPYLVSVCWLQPTAIEWGGILNRRARSIFAWCNKHDRWPGYQADVTGAPIAFDVGLPAWAERDLQRRLEAGELEPIGGVA